MENIKEKLQETCGKGYGFVAVTVIAGILAGMLNGFLGSGGGIIVVFALGLLLPDRDPKDIFATAVLSVLPMSMVSAYFYYRGGGISVTEYAPYYASALFGGVLGAVLLDKIPTALLKAVFAVLMLWAGGRAILSA